MQGELGLRCKALASCGSSVKLLVPMPGPGVVQQYVNEQFMPEFAYDGAVL